MFELNPGEPVKWPDRVIKFNSTWSSLKLVHVPSSIQVNSLNGWTVPSNLTRLGAVWNSFMFVFIPGWMMTLKIPFHLDWSWIVRMGRIIQNRNKKKTKLVFKLDNKATVALKFSLFQFAWRCFTSTRKSTPSNDRWRRNVSLLHLEISAGIGSHGYLLYPFLSCWLKRRRKRRATSRVEWQRPISARLKQIAPSNPVQPFYKWNRFRSAVALFN